MTRPTNINVQRAIRANDNRLVSPAEMLTDALTDIESGTVQPTRAMVLFWEEDEEGEGFSTEFYASNLKGSEMLALLDMIRARILHQMGLT
jgi:hypothetical protein